MDTPLIPISEEIHAMKYRGKGETYEQAIDRVAGALAYDPQHFRQLKPILFEQRFLPPGRVQAGAGSPKQVTLFNCYVMGTIDDSMTGILHTAWEAGETMRRGGGVGYDFSTLRPSGHAITTLDAPSSGPVSFMGIFDALCKTISSAGNRRGAQMAVLRVDHPDIETFVRAKMNTHNLTQFNVSVGVTNEFMRAVVAHARYPLRWKGEIVRWIDAAALWDEIMRATWDWAEPGVLFLDTINGMNNLWYCENIAATNPCGEQPLPPHGACLLGSFNMTKYVKEDLGGRYIDLAALQTDITPVYRAMDKVNDISLFPLEAQEVEAQNKRRMGIGVTGMANAIEATGNKYGSPGYLTLQSVILKILRDGLYDASIEAAKRNGPFPLFRAGEYLQSEFVRRLPDDVQHRIAKYGIRNSHLTSIAPTGTISLCANNVSSGIEPVFAESFDRTIQTENGPRIEHVVDYGKRVFGVTPRTADKTPADVHVKVLTEAQKYVDSAVSKTCNVGSDVSWDEFKDLYIQAWRSGAKGCTTFRAAGKRYGVLNATPTSDENEGAACYIDPETGNKTCDQ